MQGGSSELDAEGQQYLDVQRHAAAVQLLSRTLAVAHLRGHLAMPRGAALKLPYGVKAEGAATPDGAAQQQRRNQQGTVQAQPNIQLLIKIKVDCTAEDLQAAETATADADAKPEQQLLEQQQQQQPYQKSPVLLRPRPLVHRRPDAAALQRFMADEPPDDFAGASLNQLDTADAPAAEPGAEAAPAPRIVADPAQLAHHLANWIRAGAVGVAAAATAVEGGIAEGVAVADADADADMVAEPEDEEFLGVAPEDDIMDEEEWV